VGEVRLWLVGGHADPYGMTNKKSKSKDKQRQKKKQIPFGNDRKKGKCNCNCQYRGISAASR
jgi:hypothetical protein